VGTLAFVIESADDDPRPPTPTLRFAQTAVGSMLAASMMGLGNVLGTEHDTRPVIVEDWAGDPFDDDILMRLDPENPADSIVLLRAPHHDGGGPAGA
jgi:hypothetical protein